MKLILYCISMVMPILLSLSDGVSSQFLLNVATQPSDGNVQQQGRATQCREIGEYCQNHWDCCSNSCLSYAYRCVRGRAELSPPFYPLTNNEILTAQTAENVDEIVNRFGGSDTDDTDGGGQKDKIDITPLKPAACARSGSGCFAHSQCCSLHCGPRHYCI